MAFGWQTLVVGYSNDGSDHDKTVREEQKICRKEIFNYINRNATWGVPASHSLVKRYREMERDFPHMLLALIEMFPQCTKFILGHTELPHQGFTHHSRDMWASEMPYVSKSRIDMEQNIPRIIQDQRNHQKRCLINFLWCKKATLLRNWCIRFRTRCRTTAGKRWYELHTKGSLRRYYSPIESASTSLSSAKQIYNNTEQGPWEYYMVILHSITIALPKNST